MSARSRRDLIDYVDDNTQDEDGTPFIPVRSDGNFVDFWSGFFGGLLIGVAGGGLATVAPWLAGLLVFGGYGMAAITLRRSRNRLWRSLGFGFGVVALAGGAAVLGLIVFPETTHAIFAAAAARHMIFISVAGLAWAIGLVRYLFLLV